jgi:hypothetical protein
MPLDGAVRSTSDAATAGEVLLVEPREQVEFDGTRMLIGAVAI